MFHAKKPHTAERRVIERRKPALEPRHGTSEIFVKHHIFKPENRQKVRDLINKYSDGNHIVNVPLGTNTRYISAANQIIHLRKFGR